MSTALYFKYNTQLGPPYQVLVDTNFINFAIKNKVLYSSRCSSAAGLAGQVLRLMMQAVVLPSGLRIRCLPYRITLPLYASAVCVVALARHRASKTP